MLQAGNIGGKGQRGSDVYQEEGYILAAKQNE